jgi:ribosomal protein S18 acetylase RimI-like enzyme
MIVSCRELDYTDARDATLLVHLLDAYARDPMGGGAPLSAHTREQLAGVLADTPNAFSIVAESGGRGLGLANCFTSVSTFAAKPIVNIHDAYVVPDARGHGVVDALFAAIETSAVALDACKVTLEVLEGNARAQAVYQRLGFSGYSLDPGTGNALFWEKKLAQIG